MLTAIDEDSSWRGLEFHNSLGGVLEKFILRKAQTGIKAEATSLSLDSCVIENSVTSGIDATLAANQTLRVQNCSIGSNGRHGVYAKGTSGTYEVDFDHCMFTNNKNTGVLIERGDVRLRLVDCGFKHNFYNFKATDSFFNNMDLALISVWPIRTSADEDALLVLPPDDYGFFSNDIGGVVRGELNITEREQPYIVRRSIYVDEYETKNSSVSIA
ncbi:hypothetical protein LSAT2_028473 [Lamellibrachia satsuma]|nr:hypothetical protein LSAT2_028473 [Lamellibrachia satsuma]